MKTIFLYACIALTAMYFFVMGVRMIAAVGVSVISISLVIGAGLIIMVCALEARREFRKRR